jgi:hypothetical protein
MVSFPHSPGNAVPVDDCEELPIDQVVIGSARTEGWRTLPTRRWCFRAGRSAGIAEQ